MGLVEREAASEQLRSAVDAARGGAGSLVVVSGEAGVGKTSLVREAVTTALWGYCEPLATPRPLGPFRDLASQLWPGLPVLDVGAMRERFLGWLQQSPAPLVIEDAHWIDDASADVLRFLGRRLETCAGLIVVTFRDELGTDHPLRRVLGELATSPTTRVEVAPLSRSAVLKLVSDTSIDADEAYRLTGGNPFLLGELVLADAEAEGGSGSDDVAMSVRDAVAARVSRLAPGARAVVELLCVIPGRVGVAVLGADWTSVDEAARAGLLRIDASVVEFRHELVRLAVEHELAPGRRRELHAEVLRRLVDVDAEPAVLAFHARHAHEAELAYRYEAAAGLRAADSGSHRDAAEHYRRAVAQTGRFASSSEQAALWLALSKEEYLTAGDGAAREAAMRALALRPAGTDPFARSVAVRWLSRVTPAEHEAHRLAVSAVEIVEPLGPSPELAAAYAHLATNRMLARELGRAAHWARQALTLATDVGELETEVIALQSLGCALTLDGAEPSCLHLRRAVDLARDAGLDAELGRAYSNLVSAAGEARLYAVSDAAASEALDHFLAHDLDQHASYTRAWNARSLFEQGNWSQATTLVDEILEGSTEPSWTAALAAWCIRGRVRARRGDPGVWAPLDEAGRLAQSSGSLQRTAPVAAARAEAHWLANSGTRHDDAPGSTGLITAYEQALIRANAWAVGELGLWMWRHGLLDALPEFASEPYRLQVAGDPAAAGQLWLRIGCRYEAADAWCDSTDEGLVRAALSLFTDLGSTPGRHRAARRLRELGVRSIPRGPRQSTSNSPDGLTAREVEVLRWVRDGHTDSEIALRLHLSVRTVGHHVSAVLRKTGSRSRRDLQRHPSQDAPT